MYKNFGIYGLFLLLVVILLVNPRVIYNCYNNILGRICLIGIIVFLTAHNVTLGLLSVLCLIIASNMFFIEGMTIGDDAQTDKDKSDSESNDDAKKITVVSGVDRQTIHETIQPKSSNSLPIITSESNDAGPYDTEESSKKYTVL
jgi:hypothetical protein